MIRDDFVRTTSTSVYLSVWLSVCLSVNSRFTFNQHALYLDVTVVIPFNDPSPDLVAALAAPYQIAVWHLLIIHDVAMIHSIRSNT